MALSGAGGIGTDVDVWTRVGPMSGNVATLICAWPMSSRWAWGSPESHPVHKTQPDTGAFVPPCYSDNVLFAPIPGDACKRQPLPVWQAIPICKRQILGMATSGIGSSRKQRCLEDPRTARASRRRREESSNTEYPAVCTRNYTHVVDEWA